MLTDKDGQNNRGTTLEIAGSNSGSSLRGGLKGASHPGHGLWDVVGIVNHPLAEPWLLLRWSWTSQMQNSMHE